MPVAGCWRKISLKPCRLSWRRSNTCVPDGGFARGRGDPRLRAVPTRWPPARRSEQHERGAPRVRCPSPRVMVG
jgi:hypothetical protein